MESEKKKQTLRMLVHDIRSTVAVLENAFNGVVESPNSKEQYKSLFAKGKARLLKDITDMVERFEKSVGRDE
jgi:hypothetical protein